MAAFDDEEPGYWPGYVAAVSGLVQGLLVMAMALGAAIFALGQLAQLPTPAAGSRPAAPASHDPVGFVPPEPVPLSPEVTVGQAGQAPTVPVIEGTTAQFNAGFQGDAVILPDSALPGLFGRIAQARDAGARRWRVSIRADLREPRQQRAAYLRLLGLRSLLVQQGVRAADVDLWIDDSRTEGPTGGTARIEPLDMVAPMAADEGPGGTSDAKSTQSASANSKPAKVALAASDPEGTGR